ncbi:hypothetical protein OPV22_024780 [Ensete ventricosum]|uniref:Uncharacterized protein n=1 Tax=Ensete ventricosum TaxID=4639 RepID=A0AAV8Q605_ENSVE|nr:hypothetical protein OPV22_024780 [Ensete ventricosum]
MLSLSSPVSLFSVQSCTLFPICASASPNSSLPGAVVVVEVEVEVGGGGGGAHGCVSASLALASLKLVFNGFCLLTLSEGQKGASFSRSPLLDLRSPGNRSPKIWREFRSKEEADGIVEKMRFSRLVRR